MTTRGSLGREQGRQQQAGQHEVPEVIGAELQLEVVRGDGPSRWPHDAGVVDEQVERTVVALAELADGCHVGEVDMPDLDVGIGYAVADVVGSLLAALDVAAREHDASPVPSQLGRGRSADSGVAASNDRDPSPEPRHLRRGPRHAANLRVEV